MATSSQTVDLTLQLPRDTYWQIVDTLRGLFPPPETDTPEGLVHRDNAAIALVASMLPANADEADIAARCVAFGAYGKDCLRQARQFRGDLAAFLKCNAQAASMERQARCARALLQHMQAERQKREADNAAADRAAWTEHCAVGLMADALGRAPPAPVVQPPAPPAQSSAPAEPQLRPETPLPDLAAEAELYAKMYPQRAALIRAAGGLPQRLDFGPPSPELVDAIVVGTSPTLRALDLQGAA